MDDIFATGLIACLEGHSLCAKGHVGPCWLFNIPITKKAHAVQSSQQLSFESFWIGNYAQRADPEMSWELQGLWEQWFMVLYLAAGRWACSNERALNRALPPSLILQDWTMEKYRVALLTQK